MTVTVRLPFWSENQPVRVTQSPGEGGHGNHTYMAWDFALGYAHRVRAIADGIVIDTRSTVPDGDSYQMTEDRSWGSGATGNLVTLMHEIGGKTFYSSYFHLREGKVTVETGDSVVAGQEIGQVGYTGLRTGGHIHVQVADSLIWFGATSYGWASNTENGAAQLVADATAANAVALRFEGYGTTLPDSVIGPPPTVFTDDADIMRLATPGRYFAGGGSDIVTGSSRGDTVFGQHGHDKMSGGGGRDKLFGGAGRDTLKGNRGDDLLQGGARRDVLAGGDGNDTLKGGAGPDRLTGGRGADTFVFASGDGSDRIVDFADDIDTLQLSTSLWSGENLSTAEMLDRFAAEIGDDVVFTFTNGERLTIDAISLDLLADDILLVS